MSSPINYSGKISFSGLRFLNHEISFGELGDWRCESESKLWRYNLHYFDYLLDDQAPEELKDRLIEEWIVAGKYLDSDAWEPYPLSLRIVNWIKYFVCFKDNNVPESWLISLYQQADVLERSLEYHILANHFLKNVKALFISGCYFKDARADAWLAKGLNGVLAQIDEQFLDDGGHYEKTPMYHSICLEDCIDIINVMLNNDCGIGHKGRESVLGACRRGLDFLSHIIMPDGDIPLFNDSAKGIAPLPSDIIAYAERLLDYERPVEEEGARSFRDSGYYQIVDGQHKFVIDCGSVSPDYQPGHTHCDILSYELAINGRRVVVDIGVYDYENSVERRVCRATRSHNTLTIDDREQVELWDRFRVGRRAKVYPGIIKQKKDHIIFEGSYEPYWGWKSGILHSRTVKYRSGHWSIMDTIKGNVEADINNYIHLAPGIDIEMDGTRCILRDSGNQIAEITFDSKVDVIVEEGYCYPEFGIKKKIKVLNLSSRKIDDLHVQCYQIQAM